MNIEQVSKQVVIGNSVRKHFERTPDQLAQQIIDEAHELLAEIQESFVTGNPFLVAGEIGDLYILLTQLCNDLGIDPAQAMVMKNIRNDLKYPRHINDNGFSADEAKRISRESWQALGGDEHFSHLYLNFLAEDD